LLAVLRNQYSRLDMRSQTQVASLIPTPRQHTS